MKTDLTPKRYWRNLIDILNYHSLPLSARNSCPVRICSLFLDKTLRMEELTLETSGSFLIECVLHSRSTTLAALADLIKRNVLLRTSQSTYMLNIVGLLDLYNTMYDDCYELSFFPRSAIIVLKEKFTALGVAKLGHGFMNEHEDVTPIEGSLMRLQKILADKKIKKAAIKEKMTQKIRIKGMTERQIRPYMDFVCKENDVFFYDSHWTQVDWGKAKNWLKECEREGTKPQEILDDVCRYWPRFRLDLKNERNVQILLSEAANFRQFYTYRREIGTWLCIHEGESRPSFNIVYE